LLRASRGRIKPRAERMRYIDFTLFTPSTGWTASSNKCNQELGALQTRDERLAYIKAHAHVWRALKAELTEQYGHRCWFTDAEETVARLDVEHFRPKAKALDEDETEHEGYWWLAFDVSNLRLAGQIPNREHKKCFFPLAGAFRASAANRHWQQETPVFLDPTRGEDVALVAYDNNGAIRPSTEAATAEPQRRVEVTDRLLGLSAYPPLTEARQRVWTECWAKILRMESVKAEEGQFGASDATRRERDVLWGDLWRMAKREAPFSSVARSCLKFSGKGWAATLLAA
jgi:hypothetical protein